MLLHMAPKLFVKYPPLPKYETVRQWGVSKRRQLITTSFSTSLSLYLSLFLQSTAVTLISRLSGSLLRETESFRDGDWLTLDHVTGYSHTEIRLSSSLFTFQGAPLLPPSWLGPHRWPLSSQWGTNHFLNYTCRPPQALSHFSFSVTLIFNRSRQKKIK